MDKIFNLKAGVGIVIAGIGAALVTLLGGWDTLLYVLAILIVLDFGGGWAEAILAKKLNSSVGIRGIFKKVGYLVAVMTGQLLDQMTSVDNIGIEAPIFRTIIIVFLIANETLSLIEHLKVMGVPIPVVLTRFLEKLRTTADEGGTPT